MELKTAQQILTNNQNNRKELVREYNGIDEQMNKYVHMKDRGTYKDDNEQIDNKLGFKGDVSRFNQIKDNVRVNTNSKDKKTDETIKMIENSNKIDHVDSFLANIHVSDVNKPQIQPIEKKAAVNVEKVDVQKKMNNKEVKVGKSDLEDEDQSVGDSLGLFMII